MLPPESLQVQKSSQTSLLPPLAVKSDTQDALGEAHPLAAISGIFEDDPVFEMTLDNIRENRRKEAAEYEGGK